MAVDETETRPKSLVLSNRHSLMTENKKTHLPIRANYLLARKQRIERWACKDRGILTNDTPTTTAAALSTVSAQKRSESSYLQSNRILNIQLLQLSEQRQKIIDRNNFDQKLFANKQALKYKDNPNLLRTLSYVRKCCKYAEITDDQKRQIDPKIFLEENPLAKRRPSRSLFGTPASFKRISSANPHTQTSASMAETFLQHNKKHLRSYTQSPINRKLADSKTSTYTVTMTNTDETIVVDDDSQKRHVQFRVNSAGTHLINHETHDTKKSNTYHENEKSVIRNVISAQGIRSSTASPHNTRTLNSAPLLRRRLSIPETVDDEIPVSPKSRRSLSQINSAKNAMKEFRHHPERYLSASNRYLPLLRRQALMVESQKPRQNSVRKPRNPISPSISRLSDRSDLLYDDIKSFLSDDNDIRKSTSQLQMPNWLAQDRKLRGKQRSSCKIDMMNTDDDDEDEKERRLAIARLRDREFAHLTELIRSNPIEQFIEPLSQIKSDENIPLQDEKRTSIASVKDQIALSTTTTTTKIRPLNEIVHSIDSLRCSDTVDRHKRRQVDIEKNRAKLGILIF